MEADPALAPQTVRHASGARSGLPRISDATWKKLSRDDKVRMTRLTRCVFDAEMSSTACAALAHYASQGGEFGKAAEELLNNSLTAVKGGLLAHDPELAKGVEAQIEYGLKKKRLLDGMKSAAPSAGAASAAPAKAPDSKEELKAEIKDINDKLKVVGKKLAGKQSDRDALAAEIAKLEKGCQNVETGLMGGLGMVAVSAIGGPIAFAVAAGVYAVGAVVGLVYRKTLQSKIAELKVKLKPLDREIAELEEERADLRRDKEALRGDLQAEMQQDRADKRAAAAAAAGGAAAPAGGAAGAVATGKPPVTATPTTGTPTTPTATGGAPTTTTATGGAPTTVTPDPTLLGPPPSSSDSTVTQQRAAERSRLEREKREAAHERATYEAGAGAGRDQFFDLELARLQDAETNAIAKLAAFERRVADEDAHAAAAH